MQKTINNAIEYAKTNFNEKILSKFTTRRNTENNENPIIKEHRAAEIEMNPNSHYIVLDDDNEEIPEELNDKEGRKGDFENLEKEEEKFDQNAINNTIEIEIEKSKASPSKSIHYKEILKEKANQNLNKLKNYGDDFKNKVKEKHRKTKEAITAVKINLKQKQEIINDKIEKKRKKAEIFIQKLKGDIQEKIEDVKEDIKQEIKKIDNLGKSIFSKQREKINVWIRLKIEENLKILLSKAGPIIKEELKDPYMCECVSNMVDDLVDELWPEIEAEILFQLKLKIAEPYVEHPSPEISNICLRIWHGCKSWILYTLFPYDRSFWYQIRTFSFWILTIISLIPFYGIQPLFFSLIFFFIDKTDEYQLVHYILVFKKMQFLTGGCISGIVGYIFFFSCSTMNEYKTEADMKSCWNNGPGLGVHKYVDPIAYFIQIIMIWIAFLLLPFSVQKGRPKFKYSNSQDSSIKKSEHSTKCCCCVFDPGRGGRLKAFLVYDMIIFISCLTIFAILIFIVAEEVEEWKFKSIFYFIKIVYGIFSLPFLIFIFPFMTLILTKSRPTGYDRNGQCVPEQIAQQYKSKSEIHGREEPLIIQYTDIGDIIEPIPNDNVGESSDEDQVELKDMDELIESKHVPENKEINN